MATVAAIAKYVVVGIALVGGIAFGAGAASCVV
jgi:hypothetical protein